MSLRSTVVLVVLLAACNKAKSASPGGAGGMPPMPVEVAVAIRDTVVDAGQPPGQNEPGQSIQPQPGVQRPTPDIQAREAQEAAAGTRPARGDSVPTPGRSGPRQAA